MRSTDEHYSQMIQHSTEESTKLLLKSCLFYANLIKFMQIYTRRVVRVSMISAVNIR